MDSQSGNPCSVHSATAASACSRAPAALAADCRSQAAHTNARARLCGCDSSRAKLSASSLLSRACRSAELPQGQGRVGQADHPGSIP